MTIYSVMGLIATVALFLPILVVLALRLGTYKSFPVLIAYYIPVFAYNLMTEGYISVSPELIRVTGLSNNLIDAPLMLLFLSYFSTSAVFSKRLRLFIGALIIYEIIIVAIFGFNIKTITIVLAPGLLAVFSLTVYLFYRFSKIAVFNKKATGKTVMLAALVFGYGVYIIIYLIYYVFKTPEIANTFLIYFLGTTITSLTLCTGMVFEKKRIQKLLEAKLVRKELADMYKDEKRTIPVRTVPKLDFDRELWN
jgi:hypothetical protein